jgi:hypothetical protein
MFLNNGTCFPSYDISGENSYLCNCSQQFDGSQCQDEKAPVHIDLNMTNTLSVLLCNYTSMTLLILSFKSSISKSIMVCHLQLDTTALLPIYPHLEFLKFMKIYYVHNISSYIFCIKRRLISHHIQSIVQVLRCYHLKVSFFIIDNIDVK